MGDGPFRLTGAENNIQMTGAYCRQVNKNNGVSDACK